VRRRAPTSFVFQAWILKALYSVQCTKCDGSGSRKLSESSRKGSGSIFGSQSWFRCLNKVQFSFPEISLKSQHCVWNGSLSPRQWCKWMQICRRFNLELPQNSGNRIRRKAELCWEEQLAPGQTFPDPRLDKFLQVKALDLSCIYPLDSRLPSGHNVVPSLSWKEKKNKDRNLWNRKVYHEGPKKC